ncbi:FtsK/SpoIIIE domain-containing protein [Paeniglutamicibacter sp.]|uniref:FtsK/SpoIIIE domain-containing protein n=1 Tax=Paeniglutamicibacter sp. TaxID=1934391 RepID=UPI003989E813
MARKLYIRLSSPALAQPVLLELAAAESVTGPSLAAALARRWPGIGWHLAGRALEDVARLPREGRLLLCDTPVAADPRGAPRPGGHDPAVLVVMRGPDPGGTLPLRRGVYALGRGDVDLSIGDLGLSRRHALLRVTDTSIVLSDEGSANGVWFAQTPILERRLLIGDSFSAGESSFAVLPARGLAPVPARWPLDPVPITADEPGSRLAMLLVGALAPLGLGLGLFLMTRSVFFLAFSAISLLTGGLPALLVLRAKARFRRAWARATAADAKRREDLAPSLGAVAAGLAGGVAVDGAGFPALVLGHGRLAAWLCSGSGSDPPAPRLVRSGTRAATAGHLRRRRGRSPAGFQASGPDPAPAVPADPGILPDSPVPVLLHAGATVWFQGQESGWGPLLRGVLVRWLPLLATGSLRVVVLGPAGFLPSEFAMLPGVQVLPGHAPLPPAGCATIVLRTEPAASRQPHPDQLGSTEADSTVWFQCGGPAPAGAEVHVDCQSRRLVLQPSGLEQNPWLRPAPPASDNPRRRAPGSAGPALRRGPGSAEHPLPGPLPGLGPDPASTDREHSLPVSLEGIGFDTLARAIRRMLPMDAALISGPEPGSAPAPPTGPRTGAVIGDTAEGPLHLDLDADGPHLMVAGTTGSGKSELLRSLVLGLAAGSGPDALAFMLVDFKGGATLAPLCGLPHVQNFVSDLDAAAGERILDLLGHELHRRESFLARHAATDHRDYLRSRTASDPPLPKLVVLIDEFRVFATALPEALERVVHIATVGRSLGIHLVLSTQRPAGTISAPLRANIGSVIALRTIGESESNDLIGSAAAARLDAATPGMAYFRRGGGPPVKFRARVNARPSVPARLRGFGVSLGDVMFDEDLPAAEPAAATASVVGEVPGQSGTDAELTALVECISERHRDVEPAPNPFSAALPQRLPAIPRSVLKQVLGHQGVVGMLDRPHLSQAGPLFFDPQATARLMVCGLPGSGIEQVPELLVHAVNRGALRMPAVLLDGNGTLGELRDHPAVAGYFGPGDPWRITELLLQLGDPGCVQPLLLVVCGLGGWAQALEGNAFMGLEALLAGFARTAPGLGRALAVCGDRDLTGSRAASLCETRWYFPRGAGPEVLMGWPQLHKVASHVGRGVLLAPDGPPRGTEFQLLDGAASMPLPPGPVPETWLRSLPLPEVLSSADLATGASAHAEGRRGATGTPPALAVGVCGPDNRPFIWSPGPCGLVIGHEGAGKRTLLEHLAALDGSGAGHTVHLGLEDELPTHAEQFLGLHPLAARVLVDRADLRASQASRAAEVLLGAHLQVILSAEPSARLLFELGLSAVVRDQRSFLVLDPQFGADADPSGFRLPAATTSVRGRAMAIDRGTIRQIQCVNRTP